MRECPSCGHENRVGEIICTNCGTNLLTGKKPTNTKDLEEKERRAMEETYGDDVLNGDALPRAVFPEDGILRLEIVGSPLPIQVKFDKDVIVLGRRDPATGALPDVDLAPFAGYRMGVSRRHSQIRKTSDGRLELLDLGSSNGTFLNGRRLSPHTPYRINDRDQMALGQIKMQIIYRPAPEDEEAAPDPNEIPPDAPTKPSAVDVAEESFMARQGQSTTRRDMSLLKALDESEKAESDQAADEADADKASEAEPSEEKAASSGQAASPAEDKAEAPAKKAAAADPAAPPAEDKVASKESEKEEKKEATQQADSKPEAQQAADKPAEQAPDKAEDKKAESEKSDDDSPQAKSERETLKLDKPPLGKRTERKINVKEILRRDEQERAQQASSQDSSRSSPDKPEQDTAISSSSAQPADDKPDDSEDNNAAQNKDQPPKPKDAPPAE